MTKEIELTQGKVALVDEDDYEELSKHDWYAYNDQGYTWYAIRHKNFKAPKRRKTLRMHRVILGAEPGQHVDHINHDGLDNRRANLRLCTTMQNQANGRPRKGCSSQYKGVGWDKRGKKWRAYIRKNQKFHHLGHFENEEGAARAYNEAAQELFGEFARLNEVEEDV